MSYDISRLIGWQKQGHRQVDIIIGSVRPQEKEIRIWVYDYNIGEGTHIDSADDAIDLQAVRDKKEKAELARLTEKYRESEGVK